MTAALLAWPGALAIGLSLGLLGSGGSILTVPVLVYLLGQEEKAAIAGSLLVVGLIAGAGVAAYLRAGLVDGRAMLLFGAPGMLGALGGASLGAQLPGTVQLVLFAFVMLAAVAIVLRPAQMPPRAGGTGAAPAIVIAGAGVGLLTGLIGVGGGFLIVPALLAFGRLELPRAIGTSLGIVTLNCIAGFTRYAFELGSQGIELDWPALLVVAAIGIAGSLAGRRLGALLPQQILRSLFAATLVLVALAILTQQLV